jgi:diguanylate cyclase (GGDEF)-like protein
MNACVENVAVAAENPMLSEGGPDTDRPWRILELFAHNAGLQEVLAEVILLIEERESICQCAIMALREGRLHCIASAGVPRNLLSQFDKIQVVGSSPLADPVSAFWAAPSGFVDFSTAPGWDAWRPLAEAAGVRGCRAEPILSAAGELLGEVVAFAESGLPAKSVAPEALRLSARIAGIAMEQHHLMADLLYHAHHDSVTLLPNRFLLEEHLGQAMVAADRAGSGVALLHVNLDRFQTVNDLLGRGIGDLVLQQAARRMEMGLAAEGTLARTAGDEFSAVLPGVNSLQHAVRCAERLRARMEAPFAVSGHELTVTASIGCALYPKHAADALSLERSAVSALHRAKHAGRNCVRGFVPGEAGHAEQKARLESALGQALTRGEFGLVYQPQIGLGTMTLSGAEALLRWRHPVIGLVSPTAFIPIAEETGLIVPLGRWVLREACREAEAWRRRGFRGRVAINGSPVQFGQDDFVASVKTALDDTGAPPDAVELELTESALAGDVRRVAEKMRDLKSLGLSVAVDDFGTGYSSLSHLHELPVDVIKIDISFVRQITGPEDSSPVIETIIAMAHALGKTLVAEGVQTLEQQAYLAALGCDAVQGFLHGRPVPAADFTATWLG